MPLGQPLPDVQLVIDTNILTYWQEGKLRILNNIAEYMRNYSQPPLLTAINVLESTFGFESKAKKGGLSDQLKRAYETTKTLIEQCVVLEFTKEAASIAGYTMAQFGGSEANRLRNDILIASTAIANDYGVATSNKNDFESIAAKLPPDLILRLAIWKP